MLAVQRQYRGRQEWWKQQIMMTTTTTMRKFGPNAKCIISFSISLLKSGQMSNCQGPAKTPVQTPVWNVSKH